MHPGDRREAVLLACGDVEHGSGGFLRAISGSVANDLEVVHRGSLTVCSGGEMASEPLGKGLCSLV